MAYSHFCGNVLDFTNCVLIIYRKPNHKRIILKIQPEKIMGLSIHPAFYFLEYSPWNK